MRAKFAFSFALSISKGRQNAARHNALLFSRIVRHMSSGKMLDISGIYPPIPTPFNVDEDIDWGMLKANLGQWERVPFKGYVVQGSNGEYTYLTSEERVSMIKFVKENIAKGKLVVAGSGCESTRETIDMTQRMAKVGADAVLVVTPSYYKNQMSMDAMEQHYTMVADNSPVPVILYSVPGNTGIDLAPDVVIRLSSHHNIIGLKDSGGDVAKIANIVMRTQNNGFQVLAGSAGFLFPALAVGCVGGVCALANVLGNEVCELQKLFNDGEMEKAKQLQQRMVTPNGAVTRRFGVPGLKAAMEWYGLYGGPLRLPLLPMNSNLVEVVKQEFRNNGFL